MSDAEPSESSEPSIVVRDALVGRLLADLAAPSGGSAVSATLREVSALEVGRSTEDVPADLAELRADPAQRTIARALLERYLEALEGAPRGEDLGARLAQARVLFAAALFFEVHEVLEPAWRSSAGDEKRFLQGIIQAAVAWHHGTRGRAAPALRAAEAAAAKLADAPERWNGFPVAALRTLLDAWRDPMARGAPPPPRLGP